ncbi:MAG TPA: hypothetical protein VIG25_00550 [Pyrinomonadaceae bacterium]|jgi:hypothetical protein
MSQMPRACHVECHACCFGDKSYAFPQEREPPRGKRVASEPYYLGVPLAANVMDHGARPWHRFEV